MKKPKLNPNARKWVRALRSGKYKQTKGRLERVNGVNRFCCLGVACDLFNKSVPKSKRLERTIVGKNGRYGNEEDLLPGVVKKWLGLSANDGSIDNDDSLACINDAGKRFATIADIIESQPEGLFVK